MSLNTSPLTAYLCAILLMSGCGYDFGPEKSVCGNAELGPSEACDDGNAADGDGCSSTCDIEKDYACPKPGEACVPIICGNGKLNEGETCDDGNANGGDGCSTTCQIETGYACPKLGEACVPIVCGDGKLDDGEACDDRNKLSNDGCSNTCQTERGYTCQKPGEACVLTVCGNSKLDDEETCDDGNSKGGDGCSTTCQIETGYRCTAVIPPPESISIPVIYRDFRSYMERKSEGGMDDGYITQDFIDGLSNGECVIDDAIKNPIGFIANAGHPDFQNVYASSGGLELVRNVLGANGKPEFNKTGAGDGPNYRQLTCKESFDMWFNDKNGINQHFEHPLNLALTVGHTGQAESPETYVFDIGNPTYGGKITNTRLDGEALTKGLFTPLTNRGYGNDMNNNNYSFTAEIHSQFRYQGGENLAFASDDDLWVFINKQLVLDIGGKHGSKDNTVKLQNNNCERLDSDEHLVQYKCDEKLNLIEGQIYDIDIFYADRGPTGAWLKLSIPGMTQHIPSKCTAIAQP